MEDSANDDPADDLDDDGGDQETEQTPQDTRGEEEQQAQADDDPQPQDMEAETGESEMQEGETMQDMDEDVDTDMEAEGTEAPMPPQYRPEFDDFSDSDYAVYTDKYDEVILAEELCDPDELAQNRLRLDQRVQHIQSVISKLANRLQRRLMAKQQRSWEFNLEEGMLDTSRLDRVILNPMAPWPLNGNRIQISVIRLLACAD